MRAGSVAHTTELTRRASAAMDIALARISRGFGLPRPEGALHGASLLLHGALLLPDGPLLLSLGEPLLLLQGASLLLSLLLSLQLREVLLLLQGASLILGLRLREVRLSLGLRLREARLNLGLCLRDARLNLGLRLREVRLNLGLRLRDESLLLGLLLRDESCSLGLLLREARLSLGLQLRVESLSLGVVPRGASLSGGLGRLLRSRALPLRRSISVVVGQFDDVAVGLGLVVALLRELLGGERLGLERLVVVGARGGLALHRALALLLVGGRRGGRRRDRRHAEDLELERLDRLADGLIRDLRRRSAQAHGRRQAAARRRFHAEFLAQFGHARLERHSGAAWCLELVPR